mgnify:CR=1 FL=1|jgi:hypothetical protein
MAARFPFLCFLDHGNNATIFLELHFPAWHDFTFLTRHVLLILGGHFNNG